MKNIQNEIDLVIGDRQPRVEDRIIMPYTEATGLEVLRLASQVPLSGVRSASTDIQFDGMTIPKDTVVSMRLLQTLLSNSQYLLGKTQS